MFYFIVCSFDSCNNIFSVIMNTVYVRKLTDLSLKHKSFIWYTLLRFNFPAELQAKNLIGHVITHFFKFFAAQTSGYGFGKQMR